MSDAQYHWLRRLFRVWINGHDETDRRILRHFGAQQRSDISRDAAAAYIRRVCDEHKCVYYP